MFQYAKTRFVVLSLILFDGTLEDRCSVNCIMLNAYIRWFLLRRNHISHNHPQVDGNK